MKEYSWNSVEELFGALNQKCNYLILRNYEEMHDDNALCVNHEDIDILCDDRRLLIDVMHAYPRGKKTYGVRYYILLKNVKVPVDIRQVGDCYYDTNWEKNMLAHKKMSELGMYVMNDEDYYYSLAYHGILQKKSFAEEYMERLYLIGKKIGMIPQSRDNLLHQIETYMSEKDYYYMVPKLFDQTIYVNYDAVSENRIKGKWRMWIKRNAHNVKMALLGKEGRK